MTPAPIAILGLAAALFVPSASAQVGNGDFLPLSIEEMTATRERPLFAPTGARPCRSPYLSSSRSRSR